MVCEFYLNLKLRIPISTFCFYYTRGTFQFKIHFQIFLELWFL